MSPKATRREFLRGAVVGLAGLPLGVTLGRAAWAESPDLPSLRPDQSTTVGAVMSAKDGELLLDPQADPQIFQIDSRTRLTRGSLANPCELSDYAPGDFVTVVWSESNSTAQFAQLVTSAFLRVDGQIAEIGPNSIRIGQQEIQLTSHTKVFSTQHIRDLPYDPESPEGGPYGIDRQAVIRSFRLGDSISCQVWWNSEESSGELVAFGWMS